jgi:hypothetical protein
MKLYFKYMDLIAGTYVWCLMKNHFHFLVRIKDEDETGVYVFENNSSRSVGLWKVVPMEWKTWQCLKDLAESLEDCSNGMEDLAASERPGRVSGRLFQWNGRPASV